MAECPAKTPEGDALWQFSLAFYAVPGVAEALITLQDREGLDVNLILFALWLGLSGRGRLDRDRLAAADRAVRTIRTEIVEPLRSLRRRLRNYSDEDVRRLREDVKALELAGEKLAQARLARLAGDARSDAPLERRLADACGNFALYLRPKAGGSGEASIIREAFEAFVQREISNNLVVPAKASRKRGPRATALDMNRKQPCVYILASRRNGTLYVGVTSDLARRVFEHRSDMAEGFTRDYGVHMLVFAEFRETMEQAIAREKRIKKWRRAWKFELIEQYNPQWRDLYDNLAF